MDFGRLTVLLIGGSLLYEHDHHTFGVVRKAGNIRRVEEFDGPPELARFFKAGRLETIPARAGDRLAVLAHIAARFERDRDYAEDEVNRILHVLHNDFATLRRYLIDAGLLRREQGRYRRM